MRQPITLRRVLVGTLIIILLSVLAVGSFILADYLVELSTKEHTQEQYSYEADRAFIQVLSNYNIMALLNHEKRILLIVQSDKSNKDVCKIINAFPEIKLNAIYRTQQAAVDICDMEDSI